jgi:hypothetical protein
MAYKSKSDAKQIPDPEQKDLLEDDFMEAIALARWPRDSDSRLQVYSTYTAHLN